MDGLPAASSKLRLVLDYVPCEPCLAQPVADQELLCTVCARLHRQVAVRVASHTTVILERPTVEPAAPVVIEPAATVPQAERGSPDVAIATPAPLGPPALAIVFRGDTLPETSLFTVVVEPYEEPVAVPLVAAASEPVFEEEVFAAPPAAPVPVEAPAEPEELQFDEGFEFVPPSDTFEFVRGEAKPQPAPKPDPTPPAEPIVEDDFVFRPPTREEPAPEPEPVEPAPTEEIVVEPAEERTLWSPPAEFLPDEAPAPAPAPGPGPGDDVIETEEVVEMEALPEEEPVLDAELVEDDVTEMEVLPDEEPSSPSPPSSTDLYELRGFDAASEGALARVGIREIAHLAGHDAGELAERTGLQLPRLLPWTQVANLHAEIGVPLAAAQALVQAGIAGPRGLRDLDGETIVDRVQAFGGMSLPLSDVKRWKRRA